ncbi:MULTISPECIES: magnesium transporter CorA family protein [unclassified Streptomyces]|uniref:magnesium transporter CorA family protein n=1 Tax=unclassified Streptomyces TaxID=2593676 RepID=UPI002E32DE3D|nr:MULTISPECIES: CorA family divalent cation transporter [unclassified Streptomyces]WUC68981.1 CorA family divalent cation transporter [Streptomyces sp. NBC_00539]
MIVSVVSVPEGVVTRTTLSEAREQLAGPDLLIVDIDPGEDPPSDEQPLSRLLGLPHKRWEWFGGRDEPVRAEYYEGTVGCVVPVTDGADITHMHVLADEQHLILAHHGRVALIEAFFEQLPQDRPSDGTTTVFLLLHGVVEGFRRTASRTLLEVEELEEEMFEQRRPQHVHRLAELRRRSAQLHRAFLPYAAVAEEFLTHRRMAHPELPEERAALNRAHERTVRFTMVEIESLRDETRRAADTYASLVADQQNLVINKLAIASVIFLPLSFLTGFFGMNFTYLTNAMASEQSFLALGLGMQVFALAVAIYAVLYRTHWRQLRDGGTRGDEDDELPDRSRRRRTWKRSGRSNGG